MTDNERLTWYREQQERALDAVRRVDEGKVQHLDLDGDRPRDVTAEWRQAQKEQADTFSRLIASWGNGQL